MVVGGKLCLESLQSCDNQTVFEDDCFTNRARDNSFCTVFVCKRLASCFAVPPLDGASAPVLCPVLLLQSKFMVTAVEIRGYEPLFTEDNRRLCGCLAPLLSLPASQAQTKYPVLHHSIAHSSLFPTSMYLHWHFRPKKWFF